MKQRDCAGCGAPVGLLDQTHCSRCRRGQADAATKALCPGCGQQRVLDPGTGCCVRCSRTCPGCGRMFRSKTASRCRPCERATAKAAARRPCPRCGRAGFLRENTGWCGHCSRPRPAPGPARTCRQCGASYRTGGRGLCSACWQRDPQRPFVRAATLTDTLAAGVVTAPSWLDGFIAHLAARHCPSRTCSMLAVLERLLLDDEPNRPDAILDRARQTGRSMGSLARALEGFFTTKGLALPTDQAERRAAERRRRRVAAVPDSLRPAVEAYAQAQLSARERARRAGTSPRADHTTEMALQVLRDLAVFLVERGRDDWAVVSVDDVEAFLARAPANRARQLTVLRAFFRHANRHRVVLVDPTTSIRLARRSGFRGRVIDLSTAKALFRRWRDASTTDDPTVHPHEALAGLLGLLHAAASHELATLTIDDVDHQRRSVLLGRRPHSTPLDPHSWDALTRALRHRDQLATTNPHVLVTRGTKADRRPASAAYLHHVLDHAQVTPRMLRSTRLVDLVAHLDPKLAAVTLGMTPEATLIYLADVSRQQRA